MKTSWKVRGRLACLSFVPLLLSGPAFAAGASKIDSGDTAWMLISTALVLLMTPGLAFFYGGMVQTRNVVSTLFQSMIALGIVGLLWALAGYSLAFSGDHGGLIGDLRWALLESVGQDPNPDYAATIPHLIFMMFQCMFAVITPALITGAFAERIRFKAWMAMTALWSLLVYVPVAHWVWSTGGWIHKLGALDFAGGMVVHMTAGFSALTVALIFRKRKDFEADAHKPYDTGMIILGTALLWFGWFGFNSGSALSSSGLAGVAFTTTFLAAAASLLGWVAVDTFLRGQPSAIGACVGAVAGLVAITPAAGFVTPMAAILIGLITALVCNFSVSILKNKLRLDDTLDVFGCHGMGGLMGTLLTGIFASKAVNPGGADGLLYGNPALLKAQLLSTLGVAAVSVFGTFLVIKLIGFFTPVQVSEVEEHHGLDLTQHGEWINSNFGRLRAFTLAEATAENGKISSMRIEECGDIALLSNRSVPGARS